MPQSLIEHFSKLPDPRVNRNKRHKLIDIIVLCVCAVVSGAEGWAQIEAFGEEKLDWLRQFVPLANGIPCDDTIARTISALSPAGFSACFSEWSQSVTAMTEGEVVAIDGKQSRRSHDSARNRLPLHLVSAWASNNGVVLGQQRTDDKSNEITALPALLERLALKGCIVTVDAMHCQEATAAAITAQGANYLLAVKGNQSSLHQAIVDFFSTAHQAGFRNVSHQYFEEADSGHGRVEHRRYWLCQQLDCLPRPERWAGLVGFGMAETERHTKGKITCERRYYLTSLASIEDFSRAVRTHWSIENNLHWVLDVSFDEDRCRIRREEGAHNFSVLRHIALNLVKREPSRGSVPRKRLRAALNDAFRTKILTG